MRDGYVITGTVRENDRFLLQRGLREKDRRPALLKYPTSKHPSPETVRQLEHESDMARSLTSDLMLRPIALEKHPDHMTLVLEDFEGVSLNRLLGAPMDVGRFLHIAVQAAAALGELHVRGVIHKDVRPDNFIVNVETGQLKLTDFGIASLLPREYQRAKQPSLLEGSLPYMSPEQTGRMNRATDQRTDLYSLGVSFYEMLTGQLPYRAADPLGWVHCHIARAPLAPHEVAAGVPPMVSMIVLRLLSKVAEARYQTAQGLEHDLRTCLAQWESHGHIERFSLGREDFSERLQVPQKLYGREREVRALLGSFDWVVRTRLPLLVVVSGYSGIGKSALVHELHKPVVAAQGLFLSGKFDQNKRDIPYSTVVQAFAEIIRQILTEPEAKVQVWRERLSQALGCNAQLIVDLIPELGLVLGPQPAVAPLPLTEEKNRFNLVFRRLLGAFASDKHPLTLFLDDLQWADASSLALVCHLVTHPDVRNLLVVGSYRDNEVDPTHPLSLSLDEIRAAHGTVRDIVLGPLSSEDVDQLVMDALRCDAAHARPLSAFVHEKTRGNPFFALQLLMTLHQHGLLTFDRAARAWTWDPARIQAQGYTDNVVDLMVAKVQRLAPESRAALTLAACVGTELRVGTLAVLRRRPVEEVRQELLEALREGLLMRVGEAYRFAHDRVQQAAYLLIPADQRAATHLAIGRALLAATPPADLEEHLFDLLSQLNRGLSLVTDAGERERLAGLNALAGRRARASAAYEPAIGYLSAGIGLLEPTCWRTQAALTFDLHFDLAACTYLSGDLDRPAHLLSELLGHAETKLQEATIRRLQIDLYTSKSELDQAVAHAISALALFGIDVPAHPTWAEVEAEYGRVWRLLGDRQVEDLLDLPSMTDAERSAAQGILAVMFGSALSTDRNLPFFVYCQMVSISLTHGNSDASALAYAYFGMSLGPAFGRYEEGYRFAKLGYDLMERRSATAYKAKISFVFGDEVLFWTRHLRGDLEHLNAAFRTAVETGDVATACYCCNHLVVDRLILGDPLDDVFEESERRLAFTRKARFDASTQVIVGIQRLIQGLRGRTDHLATFSGEGFDEDEYEAAMDRYPWAIVTCWYYVMKLEARVLSTSFAEAVAAAARARELLWSTFSHAQEPEYWYYGALALSGHHDEVPPADRPAIVASLREHEQKLAEWSRTCPENFRNKHALCAAEIARIEDRPLDAMRLYDEAARSARENGYVQNEAIANETAARFYLARGFETIASAYLREAKQGYAQWGADGKVAQLEQRYANLLEPKPAPRTAAIQARPDQLDLMAALEASQAISREIVLSRLLETLMRTLLQQAGAQRGFLLLARDGKLGVEAEAWSGPAGVQVCLSPRTPAESTVPESIVNYVRRSHERVLLDDAAAPSLFSSDASIEARRPRSLLCVPLLRQTELMGVLHLENNLVAGAFTPDRLTVVELIASQAVISLQNAELYAELEQASLVVESSPTVLFRWKAQPELIAEYVSANVSTLCGYPAAAFLSGEVTFSSMVHPDDRERVGRNVAASAASGRDRIEQEYRIVCANGAVRWVDDRTAIVRDEGGGIRHHQSIVLDITERKEADEALRRSDELLRAIVDNTTAVIYVKDVEGHYLLLNRQHELLFGPRAAKLGKVDRELFPKEVADRFRDHDLQVLGSRAAMEWEERVPQSDGEHTYISVKVPLLDTAGTPYGVCGISTDITHRAQAERERARLLDEAREALRLRDEFLSIASHELRTPLTAMRLQMQLVRRLLEEPEIAASPDVKRFHKLMDISEHQLTRLVRLVDDLLDVSRISVGHLTLELADVDLAAQVERAVEGLRGELATAGCQLTVRAEGPVVGHWDGFRIEQVLVNLLTNALKYGAGAPITVGVRRCDGHAELWVEDHGVGVPVEAQARIFNCFERAVSLRSFGGLGLGLYIARRIVEAHEGTIRVSSAPGRGARFTVELPTCGPRALQAVDVEQDGA